MTEEGNAPTQNGQQQGTHRVPTVLPLKRGRLPIVVRFGLQIVTGAMVFAFIAGVAVILSVGIDWLENFGLSTYIMTGLRAVEMFIFGADCALFIAFVCLEGYALIGAMLTEARGK